jgi:Na+-driven multidrug efflux pump
MVRPSNHIRKLLIILAPTLLIFGILTVTTATLKGASDGDDTWGYPFTCFIRFSGNCAPCLPDPITSEIYFFPLLFDLLFAAIIPLLGWIIYTRVKKRLSK